MKASGLVEKLNQKDVILVESFMIIMEEALKLNF
jgi:hypothetical protein